METIPGTDREQWLTEVKYALETDGFEAFADSLRPLFKGFKKCLLSSDVDLLLLCYQTIIGSLPKILEHRETEAEFVKLLPVFVENLGSQKTVVRKHTHRCIASYVKLSLKLELVLNYIINVGLVHTMHRTRQHSMLVIPALLSLKKSCVKQKELKVVELIDNVAEKLFDQSEVVQKTAK